MLNRFLTRARNAASGSPALFVAPMLLLLAVGFWLARPDTDATSGSDTAVATRQSSPSPHFWGAGPNSAPGPEMDRDDGPDRGFDGPPPDDRRDGPPRGDRRRGGGRHHGPPPPFLPPTVIFMIGGALGYLVGTRQKGCCHRQPGPAWQPPAPPAPPAPQG